ncbi:MAG: protein kinase domain-containing protein [Pyrinomonadaceae bacterium]
MTSQMEELPPNTSLSHYRIVSKIGAGGMGEVYLAQDTKLDRKVALKVLPADVASNRDRMERFVREAKAAAGLSHPNIAQIFEIGEDNGTYFIAMEFVDGETFRELIREQTDLAKLLRYLQHVAEGLAKAHAAGVVHRDLKPDNIMVTRDGHAKVLDFGLAKLIAPPSVAGSDSSQVATAVLAPHSTPGTVMGTVGYMSPEQARGKIKIDERSDIFSFGCILFEVVTGHKAFEGEDAVDSLNKIIREPAPPISQFRPDAPDHLQRVVRRCLAKDPDDRYQTIKDVANELKELRQELVGSAGLDTTVPPARSETTAPATTGGKSLGSTAATPSLSTRASSAEYVVSGIKQHKLAALGVVLLIVAAAIAFGIFLHARNSEVAIDSIAVLPFENKSSGADTEYLSDGLAESLIYRLSQLPNLKVSPTSSVMRYKGKATDVKTIANELGVSAVLTGRIAQRGDNLTISVELVDVRYNKLLWGEQYDRKMSELLATQREIATEITQKLQLKLAGTDAKGITKRYTDSNEAYQLYLKGRYSFAKRTKVDMQRAIEYFQQAIDLDPKFALAYARISEAYGSMPAYPYLSPKEAFPQAKTAAQKALEIDPTLSEAHTFLAYSLAIYDWNWVEAEREFKRAIELEPNNASAHFRYGQIYLASTGRIDEAIAEIKRGLDAEPLDINMGATLAWVYFVDKQNGKALEQARKTYELEPSHPIARWMLSQAYILNEKYAEAIALNEQWLQTDPTNQFALRDAGIAYAKSRQPDKAEEMISRMRDIGKTQYLPTCRIAAIYLALDQKDKAFDELNKAVEARDWEFYRLNADWYWDTLRGDPRFKQLLRRTNLPE